MNMTVHADRRTSPRQPAVENSLCVEWWEGAKLCQTWGRLLDVGCGGASLAAPCPLPAGRPIWVRLEEPAETDWAMATVVHQDPTGRAGVGFREPCSVFFLHAATLGSTSGDCS